MTLFFTIAGYLVVGVAFLVVQIQMCPKVTDKEAEQCIFRSIFWPITIFNYFRIIVGWLYRGLKFVLFEDKQNG